MQNEHNPRKGQATRSIHYLLCDPSGRSEVEPNDGELVFSPIQCLDRTVDTSPAIIAIRFGQRPIREREALVELCAELKRNSHAREIPILALLHSKHRKPSECLEQVKVDYVRYVGEAILDPTRMRDIIQWLGPDDRIGRHLAMLCPFLHYSQIDFQHEITLCGAYQDQMVLGGRRMNELCETDEHLHCEYFLKPRER